MTNDNWWASHENVCTLLDWMADNGYSGHDVAYAHEKPWKFADEYEQATAALGPFGRASKAEKLTDTA